MFSKLSGLSVVPAQDYRDGGLEALHFLGHCRPGLSAQKVVGNGRGQNLST